MTTKKKTNAVGWLSAMLLVAVLVAGPAPATAADEPKASPPSDKKGAATDKGGTPAWSPPAKPPTKPAADTKRDDSRLPPPVIRVRRRGGVAIPPATTPTAPRVVDVPSEVPAAKSPPPPPPPPVTGRDGSPASAAPPRKPDAASSARVLSIEKVHNVPRADGSFMLRLRVRYEITGEQGKDVYVGAWFLRKGSGTYIPSNLREHADPQGYVSVQTRPARVVLPKAVYAAMLEIPYDAFPVKGAGDVYEVDTRLLVLREESGSRMTVLARGETTFKVHAAAEETEPKPKPPPIRVGTPSPGNSPPP